MREVVVGPEGFEEWETMTAPYVATVWRNGWVVFEALKSQSNGRWYVSRRPSEAIPMLVANLLPEAVRNWARGL